MANIRIIKRRIKGVRSTAKITRAMEMIAASRMRRAQERGLAGRPYADKIQQVIADLAALTEAGREPHPLLQRRQIKKIALVHITPDRGMCGGLVSGLNRAIGSYILKQEVPVSVIAVGRKGLDFIRRCDKEVIAEFTHLGDRPSLMDTLPIAHIVIDDYSKGAFDLVCLVYARFVTTMVQHPCVQQLLPVEPASIPAVQNVEYIYEPGPEAVLSNLLPRFVEMEVYHAILESIASEQSARMVAMKNATDNATELIDELTLLYNKARQEAITKELLDIAGGVEALA
ncbi:MAG: ATP synthase F1 subunit gamma [Dehalococcoidia bacterium]|nr:MAG: ATP synthase F1 subunit gamma [Dehalococcoidia bacterium]